jgi:UDP-N-acetylmuramoyl-L-alanyl-D-glutamate--2,6-diaminopimelate ligase
MQNYRSLPSPQKITNNSIHVKKGYAFCAYPGKINDGRNFIDHAISNGASLIMYEETNFDASTYLKKYPKIKFLGVRDLAWKQKKVLDEVYGNLNRHIKLYGVTGTNGKTSTAFWLNHLLGKLEKPSKLIGTISKDKAVINTTPDLFVLYSLFNKGIQKNIKNFVLEVSSHGIDQGRIHELNFEYGIFTNLSRDHLDYHKTMNNYFRTKERFFIENVKKESVINIDNSYGMRLAKNLIKLNKKIFTFGFSKEANVKIINIKQQSLTNNYSEFSLQIDNKINTFKTNIIGEFNLYNLISAICICYLKKIDIQKVTEVIKRLPVPDGRMNVINKTINNIPKKVIIDYAHTPDGLKKLLQTIKKIYQGKILLVFGCGGDRDKGKRKLMGNVANHHADFVCITNDNPRNENPNQIADQICEGISCLKKIILDRKKAIEYAIKKTNYPIVVIAGKGHEKYQIIKNKKIDFSDKKVVMDIN